MTEIIGVTFPIPKKFMDRFFFEGKTVFIKPATCFKEIQPGMKFVFYQSREDTGFVGEGKIVSVSFTDNPLAFFEQFNNEIFLTPEEIIEYISSQARWIGIKVRKGNVKKRLWMAIKLKGIKKYNEIDKLPKFVPVGGQYLRQ